MILTSDRIRHLRKLHRDAGRRMDPERAFALHRAVGELLEHCGRLRAEAWLARANNPAGRLHTKRSVK